MAVVAARTRPITWRAAPADTLRWVVSTPLVGAALVAAVIDWVGIPFRFVLAVVVVGVLLDVAAALGRRASLLGIAIRSHRPIGLRPGTSYAVEVVGDMVVVMCDDRLWSAPVSAVRWHSRGRVDTRMRVAGMGEVVVPVRAVPTGASSPLASIDAPERGDERRQWPVVTVLVLVGLWVAAVAALEAQRWRERNIAGIFQAADGTLVFGDPVPREIQSPQPGTPAAAVREAPTVDVDGTPVRYGPYVARSSTVVVVSGDALDADVLESVVRDWAVARPSTVAGVALLDSHPYWAVSGDPVVLAVRGVEDVPSVASLARALLGAPDAGAVRRIDFD